ncbi:MAG: Asp-tRNA(Asn)/Glu-tRNA(Gln) amidotransferase subunit GatC [Dehalococcoidia bacterium]
MSLSHDEVLQIARLARIGLTDADVQKFASQLSTILDHFQALAEIPTDGVEPTAHPLPLYNVMREDLVEPSLPRARVLANAPDEEAGMFRVRAVLE